MQKIKNIIKSDRFREIFVYGIVGVLTTVISYGTYFVVTRGFAAITGTAPDGAVLILVANIVSWIFSVAFAFWANKKYVFRSADWSRGVVRRELTGFVAARLFSLAFDAGFMELVVYLGMNDLLAKLLSNVLVIVINYFLSKFMVFKKKKG